MKKFYVKLICLSALILSISACDEYLNLEPVSSITVANFWNSPDQATAALNGMYHRLRTQTQNRNLFLLGEARSNIWEVGFGTDVGLGGSSNAAFINSLTVSLPGPDWQPFYTVIHHANLLLKYTPDIDFANESEKNRILAEAHAMRAFVYFVMVRTWGELILKTDPVEGYDPEEEFETRSSVEEVFDLIKRDLDDALALFPDNSFPSLRSHWSKPAVYTLKADVYLWTGKRLNGGNPDFNTALNAIAEVEKSDVALLNNFKDVFDYDNKGNKEVIMCIHHKYLESGTKYSFGTLTGIEVPLRENLEEGVWERIYPWSGANVHWRYSRYVIDQFNKDHDTRYDATVTEIFVIQEDGSKEWGFNFKQKWEGLIIGESRYYYDDYYLYRYADVVLMKAEAKNALGQDPSTEINIIRERAYGDNYDLYVYENGTKEQNDEVILQERLFEFIDEGKHWWTLVRFDKAFELIPTLQDRAGQDHLLLWPIGENILSREPGVEQNPGYGYE